MSTATETIRAFYFEVLCAENPEHGAVRFRQVSGLGTEYAITEIRPNNTKSLFRLPQMEKHPNLILHEGVLPDDCTFYMWCKEAMENHISEDAGARTIDVVLRSPRKSHPLMRWTFYDAWPVRWSVMPCLQGFDGVEVSFIELSFTNYKLSASY